ncbi:unnamed protein product [Trichogramma brassicae]|uniref:Uncharacterized protein n=1 Tax=Trichogramma brassicae TaxID=86971 RepID=A0A6H5J560_9HYME|nr:unnamed protein product [Trichogramma brassicae]
MFTTGVYVIILPISTSIISESLKCRLSLLNVADTSPGIHSEYCNSHCGCVPSLRSKRHPHAADTETRWYRTESERDDRQFRGKRSSRCARCSGTRVEFKRAYYWLLLGAGADARHARTLRNRQQQQQQQQQQPLLRPLHTRICDLLDVLLALFRKKTKSEREGGGGGRLGLPARYPPGVPELNKRRGGGGGGSFRATCGNHVARRMTDASRGSAAAAAEKTGQCDFLLFLSSYVYDLNSFDFFLLTHRSIDKRNSACDDPGTWLI